MTFRSTKHLVDLVNEFGEKGINFVSLKDSIDRSTATGILVFTIFAAVCFKYRFSPDCSCFLPGVPTTFTFRGLDVVKIFQWVQLRARHVR
jgi:hypothetical protein